MMEEYADDSDENRARVEQEVKFLTSRARKVAKVQKEIDAAVAHARQSPLPEPEALLDDLWA